jgi:hypothetical protein
MRRKIIPAMIWAVISVSAGAAGSYFFKLKFWLTSLIAGMALIVNGLIVEWEDREKK